MYIETVGELKALIESLDDNTPLISKSGNFELNGEIVCGAEFSINKFKIESKEFLDAFDYERYHTDVYTYDANGNECLKIS
jgi:hypothetical protein